MVNFQFKTEMFLFESGWVCSGICNQVYFGFGANIIVMPTHLIVAKPKQRHANVLAI